MYNSNAVNLRFISWNIRTRTKVLPLLELLKKLDGHLVALQQVTPSGYQALVDSGFFPWSAFSLDWRPPLENDIPARKRGTAIFGRPPFEFKRAFLLDQAPWPERALFADVRSPVGPLTISSFHVPNGSKYGDVKPKSFLALTRWLADHPERMIVGIDTNSPKTDHPDIEQNEWWYKDEESMMLGPKPLHALKDTLRVWLEAHPREAEELYALRPQGPLAISYYRAKGKPESACRYDFIYVTSDFSVSQIHYLYDEAIRAGSDHAVVISDLVFTPKAI